MRFRNRQWPVTTVQLVSPPIWWTKYSWPPVYGIGCSVGHCRREAKSCSRVANSACGLVGGGVIFWSFGVTNGLSDGKLFQSSITSATRVDRCARLTAGFVAGWWFEGGSEKPCYPDQNYTTHLSTDMVWVQKPWFGTRVMDGGNLLASRTQPHIPEWEHRVRWLVSRAGEHAWGLLLCNAVASSAMRASSSQLTILRRHLPKHTEQSGRMQWHPASLAVSSYWLQSPPSRLLREWPLLQPLRARQTFCIIAFHTYNPS